MPRSSDLGPPREDGVVDPPVAWSGLVGKCTGRALFAESATARFSSLHTMLQQDEKVVEPLHLLGAL